MYKRQTSTSPEQTQWLATRLANHCVAGDCILLSGDLGVGKTCFSQGFIHALSGEVNVQSPTFLLVKSYEQAGGPTICHMDFYRIEHEGELLELGLEEYLDGGVCLIEWPEIAESYFPADYLHITIGSNEDDSRTLTFFAKGDWQERLNNIHFLDDANE